MKKKAVLIIAVVLVVVIAVGLIVAKLFGINLFVTAGGLSEGNPLAYSSADDLISGKAYVWHHEGADITDDLSKDAKKDVFFTCITGDYNFKNQELEEELNYPRSIWMDDEEDENIPTVTSKDKLVYVSSTDVPDSIVFERFADYGYTIGVSNLIKDMGGHYYIEYMDVDDDEYKYFIDMKSDAAQLTELEAVTKLYLDKAGDVKVNEKSVSDGGTVLGLKKGKTVTCEFYTGTYYQDFNLTANIHSFSSMERFVSYDYEFMHSSFIVIDIPEYLKSGYYFVNGVGLFRYVSDEDAATYNGEAYDAEIGWNDPIIIYNEDGTVKYDPSDPDFNEKQMKQMEESSDAGVDEDIPTVEEEEVDESD